MQHSERAGGPRRTARRLGRGPVTGQLDHQPAPLVVEPFEAFYLREYPGVVKLALAVSGSHLAAEDIAQEAFLRAYRDWQRISQLDRPVAWVRKVAVRTAGHAVHRRRLEVQAYARVLINQRPAVRQLPADEQVWRAVHRLPRRQAQVIALFYASGCSVAEVAEVLGMAEGTVKAQLHRGRQALASRLASRPKEDR
jgi:RNA polymerase sigma-70 factor, ECF subfamily